MQALASEGSVAEREGVPRRHDVPELGKISFDLPEYPLRHFPEMAIPVRPRHRSLASPLEYGVIESAL
jgi:hypothetical protein